VYVVGIDLGTTHCALASVDTRKGAAAEVVDFPVPQLVRPGELSPRPLLPSCVYLPSEAELPGAGLRLPWSGDEVPRVAVGELARWQGAKVPGRLVASAKSWLCHPGVDRSADILPWGAPADVAKLSPVEASALLLRHLAAAWDAAHPGQPLSAQEVVVTVPASFDEAARALTVSAIRRAGIQRFTLLEEPQAAFYDFTSRHRADLPRALSGTRLVLVVDVGGGTSDFTLVHAGVAPEGPVLKRLAVGEHLVLGGDNMDAAVAKALETRWAEGGRRLSATQWTQLLQAARTAKEALLADGPPERHGVSLVAEGSRLLGGTLSGELSRDEVQALVLDGFFPRVDGAESPRRSARLGIQELGLPFAQDPAITRHLAAFLRAHAPAVSRALGESTDFPRPDAVLLNGGVFNSPQLSARLLDVLSSWWPDRPRIPLLAHGSLDRSVARGAAWYGLVRKGFGLKIGGGAARAFYVGVAGSAAGEPPRAVCLIPRGLDEGGSVALTERPFTLTLGRPVQFPLYASTADRLDAPGEVVEVADEETFRPLPPLHALLRSATARTGDVAVQLSATLTELGTLELFAESPATAEKWRLEFELRGATRTAGAAVTEPLPARFSEAVEEVVRIFGNKPLPVEPRDVKNLFRTLEKVLGPREGWRLPMLREIWTALMAGASRRRRSPDHERVFFQLLGYALRPGFGYPLDAWRSEESARLFKELLTHHGEKPNWAEFWVAWRRVAGGMDAGTQGQLYDWMEPHLRRRLLPEGARPKEKLKGIQPEGLDEMVRCAASLEHLEPAQKAALGELLLGRLREEPARAATAAWALGRLGARVPLYGSAHRAVPPEVAAGWLEALLAVGPGAVDGAPFAAMQLARCTGDRARDLDPALRESTVAALAKAKAPARWVQLVREPVALEAQDEARALGDSLPAGLRLG
jgi:molecular chaperone DnaK (HSP70)